MKITKILAGLSAAAISATMMTTSAFAATTLTLDNPNTGEWQNVFPSFTDADGLSGDDYIDSRSLTPGTALDVTINFEWTDNGKDKNFTAIAPIAANGWAKIGESFEGGLIADYPNKEDLTEDKEAKTWADADGNIASAAIQADGFVQALDTSVTSLKFTISAEAVDAIIDTSDADNGWDGISFMVGNNGMKVTSIEFSQDGLQLASVYTESDTDSSSSAAPSSESKADSSSAAASSAAATSKVSTGTGTTKTTSTAASSSAAASDDTAETGATAGLALAGIALAGAALVVSHRKK